MNAEARAHAEIERIREEEGSALSSIRFFPNYAEVRLLVVTERVHQRVTHYVPGKLTSIMVIKASPQEWETRGLDLVPFEWRQDPIVVM